MNYYSTGRQSPVVDFREATINGQAPDRGLYFPEMIPRVNDELIKNIGRYADEEIAFRVIHPYVAGNIPDSRLMDIVRETISFPLPLVKVTKDIYSLELFHGPTLAFKDIGARFMSRCLGYFVKDFNKKVTVLVATSGDTGGAVASGFYGVEGVEVIILYPSGKVSPVQEKQLTANGGNIHALEIEGSFDDCQQMVKNAFVDEDIKKKKFLTSANSINVARWLPQQFYYFLAFKQWSGKEPPVISVPSGNFGNICAGLLAMQSGLPVAHFIAACNANDRIPAYMQTKEFIPKPAIATISNAMDVGNPSNFIRILEIFGHHFPALSQHLAAVSIDDDATKATIKRVYGQYNYVLDPHGAVGYLALEKWLEQHPSSKGIFLETAHPVKFPGSVEEQTGEKIVLPASLEQLMSREKQSTRMPASYSLLKEYLLG